MEKVSLLMKDSSEGDSQKETMIDFILSWTLRRSTQQYSEEKPILYQYCRKILGKLIGIEMTDDVQVTSVETWKQWKYINKNSSNFIIMLIFILINCCCLWMYQF